MGFKYGGQFKWVKALFIDTVMLKFPITGKRFYLQCDASNYAYGGQLYQIDDNGEVAVVAFTSKTFKNAEKNYFATERELLAIVQCLQKFRIYILGQPLTIITDNKVLTFIQKCHLNNTRIMRWIKSTILKSNIVKARRTLLQIRSVDTLKTMKEMI